MRRLRLLLLLATAGTAGCADSVITVIQPINDRTVTLVGDSITYPTSRSLRRATPAATPTRAAGGTGRTT